jgi:hypothetical protein
MCINKIAFLFLFISSIAFSQNKKKVDTVFVYEKVFVYKTLSKSKQLQSVGFDSISRIGFSQAKEFKIPIIADSLYLKTTTASINRDEKKPKNPFVDNYGFSVQALFSQEPKIKNYGGGIGLFAAKNIYRKKLFLNVEFLFSQVFSSAKTKSIDGYFITSGAVLYYKAKSVTTQQLNLPITFSWKYKNWKPQIGIALTQKQTKLDFFAYKNNTSIGTVVETSYKLTNNYIDFMYGIEYAITNRFEVLVRSKQTLIKMNDSKTPENLKRLEGLHFFPNQVTLSVVYNLKKQ